MCTDLTIKTCMCKRHLPRLYSPGLSAVCLCVGVCCDGRRLAKGTNSWGFPGGGAVWMLPVRGLHASGAL